MILARRCVAAALAAHVSRSCILGIAFHRTSCLGLAPNRLLRRRRGQLGQSMRRSSCNSSSEPASHQPFDDVPIQYLEKADRNNDACRIAYRYFAPPEPSVEGGPVATIIFLNGLMSAMSGAKSRSLQHHAATNGVGYLCFDYRGHGSSSGDFVDCTMHDWMDDAEIMLDHALFLASDGAPARVILVGSSLGAWIAANLAFKRPESIAGIIGIGSAFDFTRHTFNKLTAEEQSILSKRKTGTNPAVNISSPYLDEPYPFSQTLCDSGSDFFVLSDDAKASKDIKLICPVRLLHGSEDEVVDCLLASDAAEVLRTKCSCDDIAVKIVYGGDHRLSRPGDIDLLLDTVDEIILLFSKVG